jgi:hypothetical protein
LISEVKDEFLNSNLHVNTKECHFSKLIFKFKL